MMKIEDQVCSRELAQKLKKLGEKQESVFWWKHGNIAGWYLSEMKTVDTDQYSAFTAAELGEKLHRVDLLIDTISTYVDGEPHQWCVALYQSIEHIQAHSKKHRAGIHEIRHLEHIEIEDKESDARAKMRIYLLENKLITL